MGGVKLSPGSITRGQIFAAAWLAAGSAALSLGVSAGLKPNFGAVVGYLIVPFFVAVGVWAAAAILRLAIVGFLPGGFYREFSEAAGPWTRTWLIVRFGLMFGGLILCAAIVVAAITRAGLSYCVYAFVYLVAVRMFLDLIAGTLFNAGIIRRRVG